MKNAKKLATLLLAVVMLLSIVAVPADAKTIKYSDTKTAKKQVTAMTKDVAITSSTVNYMWENMKYNKTKTLNFSKASDRTALLKNMVADTFNTDAYSRHFFGPNAKKDLNYTADLGVCTTYIKNLKITRSGNYYTAKCNVYLHYYYAKNGKEGYKNIKMGTATYTYKLHSKTYYGLILKKATFKRVAKDKYFI